MYKEFEDLVECPLCMVKAVNPKTLPCQHWCCEPCLNLYIETSVNGDQFLCPECRVGVQIPAGGATSFPPAIFVNRLSEVIQNQRKSHENAKLICPEHDETFKLFCEECQKLLCVLCVLNHDGHKKTTREQAWQKQKISLQQDGDHLNAKTHKYGIQMEEVNKAETDLMTEVDTIERAIRQQKEDIIMKVNAIEASVQKEITAERNTLAAKFEYSRNELKMKLSTVADSMEVLESNLEEGIPLPNLETQPYRKLIKEPETQPSYLRPKIRIITELPNLDKITGISLFGKILVKTENAENVDHKGKKRISMLASQTDPNEYKKQAKFENADKPSWSTYDLEQHYSRILSMRGRGRGITHNPSSRGRGITHNPSSRGRGITHNPSSRGRSTHNPSSRGRSTFTLDSASRR